MHARAYRVAARILLPGRLAPRDRGDPLLPLVATVKVVAQARPRRDPRELQHVGPVLGRRVLAAPRDLAKVGAHAHLEQRDHVLLELADRLHLRAVAPGGGDALRGHLREAKVDPLQHRRELVPPADIAPVVHRPAVVRREEVAEQLDLLDRQKVRDDV